MEKVVGFVTCNYTAKETSALTKVRPLASLPFLGRYRLVDFALSNMVNADIRTVGIVLPHNYMSLIDHIGSGKEWSLDRKNGGLFVQPGSAFGTARTGSRFLLRDLIHAKAFFTRSHADTVIFSGANIVYNADLNALYDAHKASGADMTVLVQGSKEDNEDVVAFDTKDGRVTGMRNGARYGDTAFLDCFVVSNRLLIDMLGWYDAVDHLDLFEAMADDFGRVNVQTCEFEGYVAPVFNRNIYYRSNMDLLDPEVTSELFPEDRSIKTKAHDTPPAKFETGSHVVNSRVSSGDRIYGDVSGSILGRNVVVEPGAIVRDSIIMQGCVIHSGARIEYAVIDRDNDIPGGTELRGTPENILIEEKGNN